MNTEIAKLNTKIAQSNKELAELTKELAQKTQRDSASMITMAAVTMFFLPMTSASVSFGLPSPF